MPNSLTVKTCNRRWLYAKLYFLVERDEKGMADFNKFLDDIGGKELGVFEITLISEEFCSKDDTGLMTMLFSYLAVPVWRWRKLTRLTKQLAGALSDG